MPINRIPPKRGGRTAYAKLTVVNPGKGLNNLISDTLINDQESSDLENIQFVESGAPSKSDGYTSVGTGLTNNPRGLGYYVDTSSNKYLLTVDGTDLKYLNTGVWTTISGASFSSSAQINFTQCEGFMFIWDGTVGGAYLSGTTLTRPGTMPSAKFSIYYNGYHIAAGVTGQENRIYIASQTTASGKITTSRAYEFTRDAAQSSLNNSTEVPGANVFSGTTNTANYVDISKNDGDRITGFTKFSDALIIFKEKSIYQLTFDSTGLPIVSSVTKSYGTVSHRSVDSVDNDVFFLSRNGIYVLGNEPNYFNVIRTNELTARILPYIDLINQTAYSKATAIFNRYLYYLGIPTGTNTYNDTVITYDKRFLAFSIQSYYTPEAFCLFTDSNNNEVLYFTDAQSAKVYKFTPGVYSANGTAIDARWASKNYDLGDFGEYKRFIDITILFRQFSGVINIEIITDSGTITKSASLSNITNTGIGSYMWGESPFGGNTESTDTTVSAVNNIPYRLRIGVKARSIKVRISNARLNENFTVLGYSITYRKQGHFGWPSSLKIQ